MINSKKRIQLFRGTTLQNNNYIGRDGEVTIDKDNKRLIIHDGVTPGGVAQANIFDINSGSGTITGISVNEPLTISGGDWKTIGITTTSSRTEGGTTKVLNAQAMTDHILVSSADHDGRYYTQGQITTQLSSLYNSLDSRISDIEFTLITSSTNLNSRVSNANYRFFNNSRPSNAPGTVYNGIIIVTTGNSGVMQQAFGISDMGAPVLAVRSGNSTGSSWSSWNQKNLTELGTNLSVTRNSTTVTVASSTGSDAVLPAATSTLAGLMTPAYADSVSSQLSALAEAVNGQLLTSAHNLNGITAEGNYKYKINSKPVNHPPDIVAGRLTVMDIGGGIGQQIIGFNVVEGAPIIASRINVGGTFSPWVYITP